MYSHRCIPTILYKNDLLLVVRFVLESNNVMITFFEKKKKKIE